MPTTPAYAWSTPILADPNNVPADLASLAQQIETTLETVDPSRAAGLPRAMATGAGSVQTVSGTTVTATGTVNFPAGRFTARPRVTLSIQGVFAGAVINVLSVSASNFTWRVTLSSNAGSVFSVSADWIAVQM